MAQIRSGGYEQLSHRLSSGALQVDAGPQDINESLGGCSITVRDIMLAYNMHLDTEDLAYAKRLAKRLRSMRDDPKVFDQYGPHSFQISQLKDVRFLGWYIPQYNCCQISTNLYDVHALTLVELYDWVDTMARQDGHRLDGSELIGLAPKISFGDDVDGTIRHVGLGKKGGFDVEGRILEEWF